MYRFTSFIIELESDTKVKNQYLAPIAVDPWTQNKEALRFGNTCWQTDDEDRVQFYET